MPPAVHTRMAVIRALASGDTIRIRRERWSVVRCVWHGTSATLDVHGIDSTNGGTRARFLLPYDTYERLPAQDSPQVIAARRWRHVVRATLAAALPSFTSLRAAARARFTLIPFQLEPAIAYARRAAARVLIADAVGLGKTVQAGLVVAEMLERIPDGRALIIVPASLRDQWRDELSSRFGLDATVLDGSSSARSVADRPAGVNPWASYPIVIASIDYIKRPEVIRSLEPLIWDLLVCDEAHGLAGRTDRARAAAALAARARTVVLLTATPHDGDEQAFARLCALGDVDGHFPLLVFRRTRADIGVMETRRSKLLRIRPTPEEMAMHAALVDYARRVWSHTRGHPGSAARLAMGILLRRACSSATSLARSLERRLALLRTATAEPVAAQRRLPFGADADEPFAWELGVPGLLDCDEECRMLDGVLALARHASVNESKLAALTRFLHRTPEPALVFTQYRDTLERVNLAFQDMAPTQLHGGLGLRERRESLRRFASGQARLLLATDAASEGLNLHQRCRLVINLEMPWTPLRLEQRIGRVDRLGQDRTVHAVHLVAEGTYEQTVVARLSWRAARIEAAFGVDGETEPEVTERVVAAATGRAMPKRDTPARVVPTPSRDEFRQASLIELNRLTQARALQHEPRGRDDSGIRIAHTGRPVLTDLARRRRTARLLWAFRLSFADASGQIVWETVIGNAAQLASRDRPRNRLREWLAPPPAILDLVCDTHRVRRVQLMTELQPILDATIARDQAIARHLARERARLSAVLLQRHLFASGHERNAAARIHIVETCLARLDTRMADAERMRIVRDVTPALLFGVACG